MSDDLYIANSYANICLSDAVTEIAVQSIQLIEQINIEQPKYTTRTRTSTEKNK